MQRAAISVVWILGGLAAAFGPEDALQYKDPRLELLKTQFDAAQQALQLAQLGISSRAVPTFNYGQSPDPYFFGNTITSNSYGLRFELGWTLNSSSIGQLSRSLEDVREAYLRLQRESTRSALQAHIRVWQQQLFLREAEARVGLAQARLAATRERREENQATDLDVQRAELGLEGARLNLELARSALNDAQRNAAAYGLRGTAENRTVRFATPEVDPKATPRYLSELANLTQAQIDSHSANFAWLPTFRIGLGMSSNRDAFGIGGALSFNEGVLGVGTSLELRKPSTDPNATVEPSWGLTLEAEINLYALIFNTSYGASARVQSQSLFLQTLQAQIAAELQARRERLALLERRLALGERAMALEQQYLAQSKALYDRGELTDEEYFERVADARSEIDHSFAWSEYVDAVSEYLELTGLPWTLRR
ncbi:TolC family protein [Calidithermus timidus]|uniref:TolC family protein n=1 Tax=Calidithermus timidus TaxID=307124 RepID=UPI00146151CA|nr:TolC family protein [Calidithermus timidus]